MKKFVKMVEEKFIVDLSKKNFSLVVPDTKEMLSEIDFKVVDKTYVLYHTGTPEEHQGKGLAGKLSKYVFDYLIENKVSFIPTCSYLVHYCKKNNIKYEDSKL